MIKHALLFAFTLSAFSCSHLQNKSEQVRNDGQQERLLASSSQIHILTKEELPSDLETLDPIDLKNNKIKFWSGANPTTDLTGKITSDYIRVVLKKRLKNGGWGSLYKSLILVDGSPVFFDSVPPEFDQSAIEFFPLTKNMLSSAGVTKIQVILDRYNWDGKSVNSAVKAERADFSFTIEENKKYDFTEIGDHSPNIVKAYYTVLQLKGNK